MKRLEKSESSLIAKFEWMLFGLGILYFLGQIYLSWNQPILDQYAFRQTQTAITTFWIAKGGHWLAYPTPVLGWPWAVPFEFPLYQWLSAGTATIFRFLTLDQAGRLVSAAFFIGCLWPAWRVTKHVSAGASLFRISSALVLFSPLYGFWSRSFMMESAALFFSIWFVASIYDFIEDPNRHGLLESYLAGVMAAGIKITTFVGFSFAGAIIVTYVFFKNFKKINRYKQYIPYVSTAFVVALIILSLKIWVNYSDYLKLQNPFGGILTSEALQTWNFGTLAQRLSHTLLHVITVRAPNEALGTRFVAALAVFGALFFRHWRQGIVFIALLALYLSTFLVFTNLHLVHHYYQYANSIFLIAAIAYVLHVYIQERPVVIASLVMLAIVCEIFGFHRYFYGDLVGKNREMQQILATYVREHTRPDQIIVAAGLSWSSEVPYYAERRAIMIPDKSNDSNIRRLLENLQRSSGGYSIGAFVSCPDGASDSSSPAYVSLFDKLTKDRREHFVGYCAVYQ